MRQISVAILLVLSSLALAQQPQRPQRARVPDGTIVKKDLDYAGEGNRRQMLDLYLPEAKSDTPRPVLVFIHGGAWRAGNKEGGGPAYLLQEGYAVASINYRLSGEAIWPAQIHDCKAAIRYLRAHAKDHNLDPDRIAVMGSSAGGHLVAMLGCSNGVKEVEGEVGKHLDVSSAVQAVIDLYGPTDFLQFRKQALPNSRMDHDAANSPESLLLGGAVQENPDKAAAANPITYLKRSKPLPPFLILHGDSDNVVPPGQSQLLHDALQAIEAESTLILLPGAGHGGREFNTPEIRERIVKFLGAMKK